MESEVPRPRRGMETAWLGPRGAGDEACAGRNLSFVQQPGISDVLKTALLNRVEDLTNARTDRLTFSRASGKIAQWVALAALVLGVPSRGVMVQTYP